MNERLKRYSWGFNDICKHVMIGKKKEGKYEEAHGPNFNVGHDRTHVEGFIFGPPGQTCSQTHNIEIQGVGGKTLYARV